MQSKDLFTFFSGREPEQVAYIKRGTIPANTVDATIAPDVDIDDCLWRVYASNDGGDSWVSDTSPRYQSSSPWDTELDVGVSGWNSGSDTLKVVISGDTTIDRDYILVGIWK